MRILAIETTELLGSVAAVCGGQLVLDRQLDERQRSAQSLAPALKQLLADVGWRPGDVDLVAVSIGPGSFTGLRLGVVTAKLFAYATGAEVLGVDTLETIAAGVPPEIPAVEVAMDAQRGEVVARSFTRDREGWFRAAGPQRLLLADRWLASVDRASAIAGPVLRKLGGRIPECLKVLEAEFWHPQAALVGRLAARHYTAGRRDDLWQLAPHYCRPSAAEERHGPSRP